MAHFNKLTFWIVGWSHDSTMTGSLSSTVCSMSQHHFLLFISYLPFVFVLIIVTVWLKLCSCPLYGRMPLSNIVVTDLYRLLSRSLVTLRPLGLSDLRLWAAGSPEQLSKRFYANAQWPADISWSCGCTQFVWLLFEVMWGLAAGRSIYHTSPNVLILCS